jgi:hypothetical protein
MVDLITTRNSRPMKLRRRWAIAGTLVVSCLSYRIADGAAGDRFYMAGSTLNLVYVKIAPNGTGELTQAFVSPGSPAIYKSNYKLTRIGYQRDTELFGVSSQGKPCDRLALKKASAPNIVIAAMGSLTQPLSSVSENGVERLMKALQHTANSQWGYQSKGLIKPGDFPPPC